MRQYDLVSARHSNSFQSLSIQERRFRLTPSLLSIESVSMNSFRLLLTRGFDFQVGVSLDVWQTPESREKKEASGLDRTQTLVSSLLS